MVRDLIQEAYICNTIDNDGYKYRLLIDKDLAVSLNHGDIFWIEDPDEYDGKADYTWFENCDHKMQHIYSDGWYSVVKKVYRANGVLEIEVTTSNKDCERFSRSEKSYSTYYKTIKN